MKKEFNTVNMFETLAEMFKPVGLKLDKIEKDHKPLKYDCYCENCECYLYDEELYYVEFSDKDSCPHCFTDKYLTDCE